MDLDPLITLAGFVVGAVVGMTGMGGGALMTPVLVLVFGVHPLAAVSSDLVASAVMKPVGATVHLRRGTVHRGLVGWLCLGSVPAAFSGVLVLRALGDSDAVQERIKVAMGALLVLAAAGMLAKSLVDRGRPPAPAGEVVIRPRPLPTVLIGAIGGLVVGLTSVGSGSLIVVLLLGLYPRIRSSQLIGSDLTQAVPLVAAAALGHLLFGDFQLGLTGSLLLGSLPGVYLGARISAGAATSRIIRPALVVVISLSGLKLVGVPTVWLGGILFAMLGTAMVVLALRRHARAAADADVAAGPADGPVGVAVAAGIGPGAWPTGASPVRAVARDRWEITDVRVLVASTAGSPAGMAVGISAAQRVAGERRHPRGETYPRPVAEQLGGAHR
ncbi:MULTISPECIES: sulfite exporter TauE/SafE family protein [Frankia]|uniref:Probable membrane transporter protein n=1 Tax=Frankia alni (strain DSM 45986 / CECT 9034 / ACN14a) TaxID=326424 RepID=Q0RQ96_FRAAA|nr:MULTISPECIES: sulfite exporter TauE/SafE family protein [Frankia]CAJ60280.1 Membrane protein, putative (partial match) [Frankia alni ACN14a]